MKNVMRQTECRRAAWLLNLGRMLMVGTHSLSLGFGVSEAGELNRRLPEAPTSKNHWGGILPLALLVWGLGKPPHLAKPRALPL